MSNIISYGHTAMLNIQPFTFLEAAGAYAQDRGRAAFDRVISRAESSTVAVRAFNLYGLSTNTEAPAVSTTWADAMPQHTPEAEPEVVELVLALPERDETEAAARAEAAAQAAAAAADRLAREREQMLQVAQEEAAQHLASAREQAAALTAEAYQQGLRQGEETARQEVLAQLSPLLTAFQQATTEITQLRATVLQQAEEDVLTLAFQFARKIIQHEISEHRHVLATTLRRALAHVAEQDEIVVRVHPDDLTYATELQQELRQTLGDIKALTIRSDSAIGRGGCIVDSSLGSIDARIEAQFDELERRVRMQHSLDLEAHAA